MATTPTTKGKAVDTVTLVLANVSQADLAIARKAVYAYRDAGNGSNRSNWERIISVFAGVICVMRTGMPVDVTDAYANQGGKAPAYNVLHAQLSAPLIRPNWQDIQAVGLIDVAKQGNKITGRKSSTARFDQGTHVLICPVE